MAQRSYPLSEAISRLIGQHPFFAVLLFDLLSIEEVEEGGNTSVNVPVPTAATDGTKLIVNKKWFGSLDIDERVFVLAHEVMHVILEHCPRMKGYMDRGVGPDLKAFSGGRWNHATDYIINDWLNQSNVGTCPVGGLNNPRFGKADLADDVYLKVPEPPPDKSNGFDQHLPGNPTQQPTKADIQRAVASASEAAKSQGKMPAGMERLVGEIAEPQVKWQDKLRLSINAIAGKDETTWAKPNRRRLAIIPHVYWPGKTGYSCGKVAMYIDTSGSVSDQELKHFMGECHGLFSEMKPEELWIGSCDSEAYEPELIEDAGDILTYKPKGGGGTHMPAIFDKLAEIDNEPEVLIILTDGYTAFGDAQSYPTIWVCTSDKVASHGETIRLHVGQDA